MAIGEQVPARCRVKVALCHTCIAHALCHTLIELTAVYSSGDFKQENIIVYKSTMYFQCTVNKTRKYYRISNNSFNFSCTN